MVNTCCTHTLCIKPFVLLLIRCPHGTVLLEMVGLDRMAVGMDVDVAAGVENQRTNGSARSAALESGGVVRNADTVRVSRTILRMCRRARSRRRLQSWRRRWHVGATTSLFLQATEFWKQNSNGTRRNSTARRSRRSTSRPNRVGSTESPNASRARARSWRRCRRVSEFGKKL